ncbi:MAG: NAD(P)/FAD-dependent oxidoreductase [Desulfobacterales bacterium]|nr:NAD(P)/FAD-dependent oxidoreductase [Desulfobacterales bacterium]
MPKKDHYVIIGNGPAGNSAADAFRANDKDARVTIISDEAFSFFYRHKLPQFVAGNIGEDDLKVRPYSVYKEQNIRLRLGQCVDRIDPEEKILYLRHMEKVGYTKLVIATGGSPRILPSLTSFEKHLRFMTGYNNAIKLMPEIQKAKTITILGGDLISFELVKALRTMKKKIFFIFYSKCFWPVELTGNMSAKICANMKKKNIEAYADDTVETLTEKGNLYTLKTASGRTFKSDLVCCFLGLVPNIGYIIGSGIDTERGVLVNEFMQTNYKDIYACGDCAQIYDPKLKDYWISIGWSNAGLQGKIAAMNLLGSSKVVKPLPKSIRDVVGIKIQTSWWDHF